MAFGPSIATDVVDIGAALGVTLDMQGKHSLEKQTRGQIVEHLKEEKLLVCIEMNWKTKSSVTPKKLQNT